MGVMPMGRHRRPMMLAVMARTRPGRFGLAVALKVVAPGMDGSSRLIRTMPRMGAMAAYGSKAGFYTLGMAMALVRDRRSRVRAMVTSRDRRSRATAAFRVMSLCVKGFCRMAPGVVLVGVVLVGGGLVGVSLMVMSLQLMRSHTRRRRRHRQRGDHRRHNQLQTHCLQSPFRKNHTHPGMAFIRGAARSGPLLWPGIFARFAADSARWTLLAHWRPRTRDGHPRGRAQADHRDSGPPPPGMIG